MYYSTQEAGSQMLHGPDWDEQHRSGGEGHFDVKPYDDRIEKYTKLNSLNNFSLNSVPA